MLFRSLNKAPMVIFSNLVISLAHKNTEMKFRPTITQPTEKTILSALNDTVRKMLLAKTKITKKYFDLLDDMELIAMTLHLVVFTIAVCSMGCTIKFLKSMKSMRKTFKRMRGKNNIKGDAQELRRINYVRNKASLSRSK